MRYGRLFPLLVIALLALPAGAELGLALCVSPSHCPMMEAMKATRAPMSCGEMGLGDTGRVPDCCRAEAPSDEAPPVPGVTVPGPASDLSESPSPQATPLLEVPDSGLPSEALKAAPIRGAPLQALLQTFLL